MKKLFTISLLMLLVFFIPIDNVVNPSRKPQVVKDQGIS